MSAVHIRFSFFKKSKIQYLIVLFAKFEFSNNFLAAELDASSELGIMLNRNPPKWAVLILENCNSCAWP